MNRVKDKSPIKIINKKKSKVLMPKIKQRKLRALTLKGAIEKSPIFLLQYWREKMLIAPKIVKILGAPIIFSLTVILKHNIYVQQFWIKSRILKKSQIYRILDIYKNNCVLKEKVQKVIIFISSQTFS